VVIGKIEKAAQRSPQSALMSQPAVLLTGSGQATVRFEHRHPGGFSGGHTSLNDNRKHSRVPSRLRCWCEGENVTVYARIGNLSEGGLFLRTSTPLSEGSRARIRFGAEPPIEAEATVVWARADGEGGPPGMGLRFLTIDQKRLEELRKLIQSETQTTQKSP
jgi:uncharacterized protein (TIGR02266 family)